MKNTKSKLNKKYGMGWIPCSERLPEDGWYLVTITVHGDTFTDCMEFRDGEWDNYYTLPADVLAWMPAPEPYRKKV